jgi:hypothetical protein
MTGKSFFRRGALVLAAALISSTLACNRETISAPETEHRTGILIEHLTPNNIEARAGSFVEPAPSVRLKDAFSGRPLAGVKVEFRVGLGAGSVQNRVTTTDASGIATAGYWQVGTLPRSAVLTAVVAEQQSSFTVLINPDVPARGVFVFQDPASRVALSGEEISGPGVVVFDRFGNPTPQIPVTFTIVAGGGSLENSGALTNRDGRVAVGRWRLGPTPGENTISAAVDRIEPFSFTVQALDAALLTRYTLEGVRVGKQDVRSPQDAGLVKSTLAIGAFDRCLCRAETGYFVMNIEYESWTPEPTRIAGEYAIQPPQLVLYGREIKSVVVENGRIEIEMRRDTYDWSWEETWIFRPET